MILEKEEDQSIKEKEEGTNRQIQDREERAHPLRILRIINHLALRVVQNLVGQNHTAIVNLNLQHQKAGANQNQFKVNMQIPILKHHKNMDKLKKRKMRIKRLKMNKNNTTL